MNITWKELETYLFGELDLDRSQYSNYESRFKKLQNYFSRRSFTRETIVEYILQLKSIYSPSTVGLLIILLQHICRKLNLDYMKGITLPKRKKVFKHTLTKEEVTRVLELAYSLHYRYALAIELSLRFGYRIGTIKNLLWVDVHDDLIVIRDQKDGTDKLKPVDKLMIHKLRQLRKWKHGHVFGSHNGLISEKLLNIFLRDILKRLNIIKYMSFHDLRHTFTTLMHDEGVDIKYLQVLLDHKSIMTTEYYTHVSIESERKVLKKHPLAIKSVSDEDVREECRKLNDWLERAQYTPIFLEGGSEFILKVPKKRLTTATEMI